MAEQNTPRGESWTDLREDGKLWIARVYVDRDMWDRAKAMLAERGESMSGWIREKLYELLGERP